VQYTGVSVAIMDMFYNKNTNTAAVQKSPFSIQAEMRQTAGLA
jgi:hypothetical protein